MKRYRFGYILILLLMIMNVSTVLADDIPKQEDNTFVSEIMVFAMFETSTESDAMSFLKGYLKDDKGAGWTGAFKDGDDNNLGNLNYGNGKDKVYILYKTTTDPREAITDIIVASGARGSYTNPPFELNINGKLYRHASRGQLHGSSGYNGNLNVNGDGNDLFIYYTTDGAVNDRNSIIAGKSIIQALKVERDGKGKDGPNDKYVKRYDFATGILTDDNADCNKGAGGDSGWNFIVKQNHGHYGVQKPDVAPCDCGLSPDNFVKPAIVDGVCQIENLSNLCWWRDHINIEDPECPVNAALKSDIDMTNIRYMRDGDWEAICPISNYHEPWQGTLDGTNPNVFLGHYALQNLKTASDNEPVGLFGMAGGTISNVDLIDVDLVSANHIAAGFVQMAKGELTIKDCNLSGSIRGKYVAGFTTLDEEDSKVIFSRCENWATVTSTHSTPNAVGFVGFSDRQTHFDQQVSFDRCVNKGAVPYAFALEPVGSITNCLNLNSGSYMMRNYTDEGRLKMQYVLNLGRLEMDESTNYQAQPDCYTTHQFDEHGYEENAFDKNQLKSGEACFLLNGSKSTDDVVWRQRVSITPGEATDPYPTPLHNDMDILRVVYKLEKTVYNCEKFNYTNYRFFAEDNDGDDHVFKYESTGNIVDGRLAVKKTCVLCQKTFTDYADREAEQYVRMATCVRDGLKAVTYRLGNTDRRFYEEEKVEHDYHPNHFNIVITKTLIDDDRVTVTQCLICGAKHMEYKGEYDGFPINDELDMLNFLLHCNNVYRNTVIFNADIDMQKLYEYDNDWQEAKESGFPMNDIIIHGNNHTIRNLYMGKEYAKTGLFGHLIDCTVDNLTIEGIALGSDAALLCDRAETCNINNVIVRGAVVGGNTAAGLCHVSKDTNFSGCHNYATIEAFGNSIGGLVSTAQNGKMGKCTNQGLIRAESSSCVGGLIGTYNGLFEILNCGNYGNVTGQDKVGGVVGAFALPDSPARLLRATSLQLANYFRKCLNTGKITITGESYNKGGLFGYVNLPKIYSPITSWNQIKYNLIQVEMLVDGSYYTGAQAMMGSVITPVSIQLTDCSCTAAELGSGYICHKLNQNVASGNEVWHQVLGEEAYPYPYGTVIPQPSVKANNQLYYIQANSTLDDFVLEPGTYNVEYAFETKVPFHVANMTYKRNATLRKNFYATIYLPFAFSDARLKILQYEDFDPVTNAIYFSEVETTEPNHPYIVCLKADCENDELPFELNVTNANVKPLTSSAVDLEAPDDLEPGFYGTFTNQQIYGYDGFYGFSSLNGDFRQADSDEGNPVYPFRAVFKGVAADQAPSRLAMMIDAGSGLVTSIHSTRVVELSKQNPIYNLNGQKVGTSLRGLQHGIYVVNGKKVSIR